MATTSGTHLPFYSYSSGEVKIAGNKLGELALNRPGKLG